MQLILRRIKNDQENGKCPDVPDCFCNVYPSDGLHPVDLAQMINVYGWRLGPDGALEFLKTTYVNTEEEALRWLKHCKLPCKDYAESPEDIQAIRNRLGIGERRPNR